MNTEDFENLLRQQSQPTLPPAWRGQILARARAAAPTSPPESLFAKLADLLWPTPKAWAGLAAVWFVILLVNLAQADGSLPRNAGPIPAPGYTLQAQHRMMAELLELDAPANPAIPPVKPSPRSERLPAIWVG